jgi:hypothetical protein
VRRLVLLMVLMAAGCADDVPLGSHLERTRVLAVAIAPGADPTRASARPGEEATLSTLVASPGTPPATRWHVEICAGDAAGACAGAPFATADGEGSPALTFVVPAGAATLHASGHLAPEGEPDTDFELTLPVESATSEAAMNHHPQMGEVEAPAGCVAPGGPDVILSVTTSASDREAYLRADGTSAREGLRLSFFTSAGELARQFAVVAPDDPDDAPVVTMKWTPPAAKDVPAAGLDVHLVVVERDLRGGVDFSERTLCVAPGKAE